MQVELLVLLACTVALLSPNLFNSTKRMKSILQLIQEHGSPKFHNCNLKQSKISTIDIELGFGMSATFIVFVCARLVCVRVRSDEDSTTIDIELGSDLDMMLHANLLLFLLFLQ